MKAPKNVDDLKEAIEAAEKECNTLAGFPSFHETVCKGLDNAKESILGFLCPNPGMVA